MTMEILSYGLHAFFAVTILISYLACVAIGNTPRLSSGPTMWAFFIWAVHLLVYAYSLVAAWKLRAVHNWKGAAAVSLYPLASLAVFIGLALVLSNITAKGMSEADKAHLAKLTTFVYPDGFAITTPDQHSSSSDVFIEQLDTDGHVTAASYIGDVVSVDEIKISSAKLQLAGFSGTVEQTGTNEILREFRNQQRTSLLDRYRVILTP